MRTGPKPAGRGPAIPRASALDKLEARVEKLLDKAEELIESDGLNITTAQGVIQNPAVRTFKEMALLLAKIQAPEAQDEDDKEPETIADEVARSKRA